MLIYIINKLIDNNLDISYFINRNRVREFNGMEEVSINMDYYKVIKKIVIEIIEYEEVEYDWGKIRIIRKSKYI